jgi:hypothetical protein
MLPRNPQSEELTNSCVETVLYTDFNAAGKIDHPKAAELAEHPIQSVSGAPEGKDGITYLADAISCGIDPLTSDIATRFSAGLAQHPCKKLSRMPEMLPYALGRRPHMNDEPAQTDQLDISKPVRRSPARPAHNRLPSRVRKKTLCLALGSETFSTNL